MEEPVQSGGLTSDDKLMAALAYVGAFILLIPTILIYITKKDQSPFIKRHCLQSIVLTIGLLIFWIVFSIVLGILGMIPVVNIVTGIAGFLAMPLIGIGEVVLLLWLAYQAYQGNEARVPILTEYVETKML